MTAFAAPGASPSAAPARTRMRRALRLLAAALLVAEGAVHVQQLLELFHAVPWIGPLFAVNGAACAVLAVWLAVRDSPIAMLAGVGVAAGALVGLALSYTVGLFGWKEVGIRAPIEIAIASEAAAVLVLSHLLLSDRRWIEDLRARLYVLRHEWRARSG